MGFLHKHPDLLLCTAAGILFLSLTLQELRLPGPHYDEVFTATPAVNFVNNTYATDPMQIDPSVIHLFGRPIPLMLMTYVGSVQTFLYVPVFALFGTDLTVVRVMPIILALFALWFSYFFFRDAFGRTVAIVAIALTLADPGFIFFVGRDFGPPGLALLCKMAGLFFFLRWWKTGARIPLLLGSISWGIGLYHKADFLWIIAAAVVAGIFFYGARIRRRLTPGNTLLALFAFCLGCLPFLALNIMAGGATFTLLGGSASLAEQLAGWLAGIAVRTDQIIELMNGTSSYRLFMGESPTLHLLQSLFLPVVVLFGLAAAPILSIFRSGEFAERKGFWLLAFYLLVFLQTGKSPTQLNEHHLLAVYPLLQGAAAVGLVGLVQLLKRRSEAARRTLIAALLLCLLLTGIVTVQQTYAGLRSTGGYNHWSDAVYDLNNYLEKENRPVVAMQWGLTNPLIVLSGGTLEITRVYREFWRSGITGDVVVPYLNPNALYVFNMLDSTSFTLSYAAFLEAAGTQRCTVVPVKSLYQRDGRRIYSVVSIH